MKQPAIYAGCALVLLAQIRQDSEIAPPVSGSANGVVRISVLRADNEVDTGAGILVAAEGSSAYIITALHVLTGRTDASSKHLENITIQVEFFGQPRRYFTANVVSYDPNLRDLAVIRVEDERLAQHGLGVVFGLNEGTPILPRPVSVIGHTTRPGWDSARGELVSSEYPHLNIRSDSIAPGHSGGPLLDGSTRLLGMVLQAKPGGSAKALNAEYIRGFLRDHKIRHQLQTSKVTKVMVPVPAGEFLMGSDENPDGDNFPARKIWLDEFQIDKHEVTVAEFSRFVQETRYPYPEKSLTPCHYGDSGRGNYPMNCVSWADANAYAVWAGKALPSEAEWEKAARGPDGRKYPWGAAPFQPGYAAVGQATASPVGTHLRDVSPFGVMDMFGNVSEWVADWYSSAYYATAPERNPTGPASGSHKVLRGGLYPQPVNAASLTRRRRNLPTAGAYYPGVGFRCVIRGR
jgi:formylglycine-generating enzyme required for sulfatase activity